MTAMTAAAAPSSRCLACGGRVLDAVEEVTARDLAAAWASCDRANGEAALAEARAQRLDGGAAADGAVPPLP